MEVIDGMQVVIEAGFGHLFGAKTAAVVEPTLDNEDVESSLGKIRAEHEAVMAGTNDDAIVVAFEGVQVCTLVLCFCAPFPGGQQAVGRIGKIPDSLRKGEATERARRSPSTSWRAVGDRSGARPSPRINRGPGKYGSIIWAVRVHFPLRGLLPEQKKLPHCGGWFLPLPELKTCTPAHRSAWLLAIFRRKLRIAILCSLSR